MTDNTTVEPKLKLCPFCGASPVVKNADHVSFVYCSRHDCAGGPCSQAYFETAAIRQWNNRPIEAALTARVAELEAEITRLKADSYAVSTALFDVLEWTATRHHHNAADFGSGMVSSLDVAAKIIMEQRKRWGTWPHENEATNE